MRRKKIFKLNPKTQIIVDFGIFLIISLACYQLFIIEELIREWINKPTVITYTNIGYYKCGGTNKNPKMCPIILKEKYVEE